MMTEAEAAGKECRINGSVQTSGPSRFPRCIASNCMQWQWQTFGWPEYRSPFNGAVIVQASPAQGDCGLKWRGR